MPEKNFEFKSYLMGGFESCYALNSVERLDMLKETKHDLYCRQDYQMLKEQEIYTVRESLAWYQIDKGNRRYDFSRFEAMMEIARDEKMQVIWSLNHFDFPKDIDLFSPEFITRFIDYALESLKTIRKYEVGDLFIIPFNEISFLSLMCAEVGRWWPFANSRGFEAKKQMVKATISAIKKIKNIDPNVYFVHGDPIMKRLARDDAHPEVKKYVAEFHEIMYQAWDMISGRMHPELGGKDELIDIIGINYYVYNQELVSLVKPGHLTFTPLDFISEYRVDFHELITDVYQRYRKPILITETGSFGVLRKPWWNRIFQQVEKVLAMNIPLIGICAYPIIDRPDWSDGHLTNSGFWDFETGDESCQRIPQKGLLKMVRNFIQ